MTRWAFTPLVAVGPLRFGMTHDEVVTALGNAVAGPVHTDKLWLTLSDWKTITDTDFVDVGVTVYYADGALYCVAVDASRGPRVSLDGMELVGRVPSELERDICDYAQRRGLRGGFSPDGTVCLPEIGLVPRTQRVGDALLSRAVCAGKRDFDMWHDMPASRQNP